MKKLVAWMLAAALCLGLFACGPASDSNEDSAAGGSEAAEAGSEDLSGPSGSDIAKSEDGGDGNEQASSAAYVSDKEYIEETLNLANNLDQEWSYNADADAWVLSVVQTVVYPELPDQQGVSVCVPGAYVRGIDTDKDGTEDVTASDYTEAVKGSLVIDNDATVTSTNGQTYTASEAPVIINTGAAGYGSSTNTLAATTYAAEGYINVSCGNRGKQDTAQDENGDTYYTGDAPSCLTDQKNAARFIRYNILLGNLPGSTEYFVSTGGSGGGAHAVMFAATSDNPDFYDYQIEAGAVGVYALEDGSYATTVTIDGAEAEISDGAWGCMAYSAITSLYEADMAMAFEYYMDTDYEFGTSFQAELAKYLSEAYMEYINAQDLKCLESQVGFDLNDDGDMDDTISLTISYAPDNYPDTNGYYGTYLDLYMAEFTENLQWYLVNLDYAKGWTWFDEDGSALSDDAVAAMTLKDKAGAFIEGRYTKAASSGFGGPEGMMGGMFGDLLKDMPDAAMGGLPGGISDALTQESNGTEPTDSSPPEGPDGGTLPEGISGDDGLKTAENNIAANGSGAGLNEAPEDGSLPDGMAPGGGGLEGGQGGAGPDSNGENEDFGKTGGMGGNGPKGDGKTADSNAPQGIDNAAVAENSKGDSMLVGTPDAGTTQAAGSSIDSSNYSSYEEMLASYEADIAEISEGDKYGKNITALYNPHNYIGAEGTNDPTWVRILMGAAEGDMSMFSSLNLQLEMLKAGIDAEIEWQWNGGHVPSEIFSESFALYVDQMYGEYVNGRSIDTPEADPQTANGDSEEASGTDISGWVDYEDPGNVSFTLADAVSYRTSGASKAIPGFDVIDYSQEDYVFGNKERDARHWDVYLLEVLKEHQDELEPLFNSGE